MSVAKSYVTEGVYLEDLINEGNIGLVEAAEKFNPTMGNKFFTYAVYWIVRNIRQYVSNNSRTVRLPINKVDAVRNVKKRMGTLEQELGRPVTVHDLIDSSATDSEINALKVMIELVEIGFTSFDSPIGGDEGNSTYHDILFDADELMPDNHLEDKDSLNIFKELLSRMKPIEQTIMFRRYGLDGGHPMTLKEISECSDISLTRERIRQIEKQVLKKLEDVTPKEMVC